MIELVNCANCGKQVEIDSPEDICYWCGEPAVKKEKKTVEEKIVTGEQMPVPPRPDTSGLKRWYMNMAMRDYYDANREAILHDLENLGEGAMRKRWGISQATWKTKRKSGINSGLAVRFGVLASGKEPKVVVKTVRGLTTRKSEDELLRARFEGYRQAVKDMCGQCRIDIKERKE